MKLTVRDAARLLEVSQKTVYRWIKQRTIPAYQVNGQYRFNQAELLAWATARHHPVSVDILAEPESDAAGCPGLVEALGAGGVFYRVGGHDRASALRALVEFMRLPDEVDREFLLQVLRAREALGSTGIGDGIAIPHARNPIVLHVPQPAVTLCFLERPVEFGALDGQPVRVLFGVVRPTTRAHLHLMAQISYALKDPRFKRKVLSAASREEIFREARRIENEFMPPTTAPRATKAGRGSRLPHRDRKPTLAQREARS